MHKKTSLHRIYKDLDELKIKPLTGISAIIPTEEDPYNIIVNIKLLDGKYKDFLLHLKMIIPENYPLKAPQMTLIPGQDFNNNFHHHLYGDINEGFNICIDILENGFFSEAKTTGWTPAYTLSTLLLQMQIFFAFQHENHSKTNIEIKNKLEELKNFERTFEIKIGDEVKTVTHSYENPFPPFNEIDEKQKNEKKNQEESKMNCYITRSNYCEDSIIFGYPVKKSDSFIFILNELLSYEGFCILNENKKLRSAMGEDFNLWLPFFYNEKSANKNILIILENIKKFNDNVNNNCLKASFEKLLMFNGNNKGNIGRICNTLRLFIFLLEKNIISNLEIESSNEFVNLNNFMLISQQSQERINDIDYKYKILVESKFKDYCKKIKIENKYKEFLIKKLSNFYNNEFLLNEINGSDEFNTEKIFYTLRKKFNKFPQEFKDLIDANNGLIPELLINEIANDSNRISETLIIKNEEIIKITFSEKQQINFGDQLIEIIINTIKTKLDLYNINNLMILLQFVYNSLPEYKEKINREIFLISNKQYIVITEIEFLKMFIYTLVLKKDINLYLEETKNILNKYYKRKFEIVSEEIMNEVLTNNSNSKGVYFNLKKNFSLRNIQNKIFDKDFLSLYPNYLHYFSFIYKRFYKLNDFKIAGFYEFDKYNFSLNMEKNNSNYCVFIIFKNFLDEFNKKIDTEYKGN